MHDVLNLLIIIGALGALMFGMLKFMLRDIQKDLSNIQSDITEIKTEMKRQESRIDHLYQICIEMLGTRHKH